MTSKKRPPPTLFMRSGYFIDTLKSRSELSFAKLERRIRENQYDLHGIRAPSEATVRDYFLLRRSVAFEPKFKDPSAPWLLATELEFPGASLAFFHPVFDLLFGTLESTYLWQAHFSRIPQQWIDDARKSDPLAMADEWEAMNASLAERKHRSRPKQHLDRLSFVHLSMMRLPENICNRLFTRRGLAASWARVYGPIEDDIAFLGEINNLDAIAGLLALAEEGAQIGDMSRYHAAKYALRNRIEKVQFFPGCKRIRDSLEFSLSRHIEGELFPRRYSGTLRTGFGLPVSWRTGLAAGLQVERLEDYTRRFPPKAL